MQGRCNDKTYAVKLYDTRKPEALHAYFHEKKCLQKLNNCPATVQFEMAGYLQDTLYPCLVTTYFGSPAKGNQLAKDQRVAAEQALKCLHNTGACHGDISMTNLLFDRSGACCLAGLAKCVLKASKEMQSKDNARLRSL